MNIPDLIFENLVSVFRVKNTTMNPGWKKSYQAYCFFSIVF